MDERTTGLILRTRPLTETSLIVNWLTADAGRIATVARGARRAKSPLRGKLDLFYVAEFSFVRSRRSELHTLKEVGLRDTHAALRREVGRLQQAAYAAALIEQTTERDTPVPEVYELACGYLVELARHGWRAEATLWFELKLLGELGLQPDAGSARVSARTRKLMAEVMAATWSDAFRFQPDAGQVKELTHFLHGFLIHHLDRLPKGRAAALKECI
jgi:DNA repair protein RecO (recombination protein O)